VDDGISHFHPLNLALTIAHREQEKLSQRLTTCHGDCSTFKSRSTPNHGDACYESSCRCYRIPAIVWRSMPKRTTCYCIQLTWSSHHKPAFKHIMLTYIGYTHTYLHTYNVIHTYIHIYTHAYLHTRMRTYIPYFSPQPEDLKRKSCRTAALNLDKSWLQHVSISTALSTRNLRG